MMDENIRLLNEGIIVEQLHNFGVDYINLSEGVVRAQPLFPVELIINVLRHPSSRVRTSLIALFLINPTFSYSLADLQNKIDRHERDLLRIFFTAAVYLQEKYFQEFQSYLGRKWATLPDLFSEDLGIPGKASPDEKLNLLDHRHKQKCNGVSLSHFNNLHYCHYIMINYTSKV